MPSPSPLPPRITPSKAKPRRRGARERHVLNHLPLVRSLAYRLRSRVPRVEMDDLVSAGTIGLIEAVDRYDDRLGVPFLPFAYRRITGAMIDELRRHGGTRPSRGLVGPKALSLQTPVTAERDLTLIDVIVDPTSPAPEAHAELGELLDALESLPSRQREMLRLSTAGHRVREIAELYGCSESRVSQLLVHARFRLEEQTAA